MARRASGRAAASKSKMIEGGQAKAKAKGPASGSKYHKGGQAKAKGPASCSKYLKREKPGEDRISQLPEDILVAILSLLTIHEAGRTSVLSCKWRYLWTFTSGRFNFDVWKSFSDVRDGIRIDSSTYVSRVNKVLKLHKGPFIDEFRIRFNLDARNSREIDRWINFAFEKGVQRFELDLLSSMSLSNHTRYNFPTVEKFLMGSNSLQRRLSHGHLARTVGSAGFCSLTALRLIYVNVTSEVIEHFLANCPLLEQLHVSYAMDLRTLKVAGSSLKLKYLEISYCSYLSVLEISAINLKSFTYKGQFVRMLLNNVPVLSELCTGGGYCTSVIYKSCRRLSYLRQLERLKLHLPHEVVMRSTEPIRKMPELFCLKQLELEVSEVLGKSLIFYTSLIQACPLLSRFAMRYVLSDPDESQKLFLMKRDGVGREAAKHQHDHLKVVELVGFMGHETELELASHLLEIAVSLDKMIINPRRLVSYPNRELELFVDIGALQRARMRARQLEAKLPPKADLVVL